MDRDYKITQKNVTNSAEFMPQFFGKWKFVRKENFDEFLKASGINFLLRKAASQLTPTEIIGKSDQDDDFYFLR